MTAVLGYDPTADYRWTQARPKKTPALNLACHRVFYNWKTMAYKQMTNAPTKAPNKEPLQIFVGLVGIRKSGHWQYHKGLI